MKKKPNILYIHCHDVGRYIQPYGYPSETPNLMKLAGDAIVFRHAFSAGPTCSPSRAALLTGQYPHQCGMLGLTHRGFALKNYEHHIIHTLKHAGYNSALAGTQHIAHGAEPWRAIGYDRYLGGKGRPGSLQFVDSADAATGFLESAPAEPFFLSVGFSKPHGVKEIEIDPRFCRPPAGLPDTAETREHTARFLTGVKKIDQAMGRVLDALDTQGLAENSLVICTTDHGPAFPGMKCTLTDGGTGVMLMMRGPGPFRGGRVIDQLVSHVDVFPTICDYLGIAAPDRLEGVSLMPMVKGDETSCRKQVFTEVSYHAAYEPMRAVRTERWKYIRRFDGRATPVLPNCDTSPSKQLLLDHGWRTRPIFSEMLFDLMFDPCEKNNLAGDRKHAEILNDLRARLEGWMEATDDPLLKGPVPRPEKAIVTNPDNIMPAEDRDGLTPKEWTEIWA